MKKKETNSVLPICAIRYALGRLTYMPSLVVNEVIPLLPEMSDRDLNVIERDLREFLVPMQRDGKWDEDWGRLWEAVLRELRMRENDDKKTSDYVPRT